MRKYAHFPHCIFHRAERREDGDIVFTAKEGRKGCSGHGGMQQASALAGASQVHLLTAARESSLLVVLSRRGHPLRTASRVFAATIGWMQRWPRRSNA